MVEDKEEGEMDVPVTAVALDVEVPTTTVVSGLLKIDEGKLNT